MDGLPLLVHFIKINYHLPICIKSLNTHGVIKGLKARRGIFIF